MRITIAKQVIFVSVKDFFEVKECISPFYSNKVWDSWEAIFNVLPSCEL